ncbi:uncharacterized protein K452DRAFT_227743 [Aplosporella prunicola CBS 121167]|uniref:Rhodanese domain-containing protein n=1 Tax=Aplosporella prunicola CBS 121167 TaxID=1176127 RepID=A0A6A6BCP8_9PEZI|nr:uncharacterized protein K452DRAFT_227743 [Aplosporella prunicola CBS 121167]KAF2141920.1 hypothetical protein K452DRAFT_227743 [Aplosporella prunicola CBS 121167]
MANHLNVYSGEDSLKQYFNPDCQPPLPLVEIPGCLNPYRQDGVRIYAKMMTMLPANNVKSLPALNMLSTNVSEKTEKIIEYSSGSTVISMSLIGRVFHGINDTGAYLSNKTSDAKLRLMQFFGLNITLFGGPSQPEPLDNRGGIQAARLQAIENDNVVNPNQYENEENWRAHYKWTGPQILKQLPEIQVLCAGMGTSGTMTGIGTYFKDIKPSVIRVGVCTAAGDRVPGPRSYALMAPVVFPWRAATDMTEEVGSVDAYALSLALSREGLICGPSSGFNLQGLYQFIEKRKSAGTLDEIRDENGETNCVFLCCDLPYQYINEYFGKLDANQFSPITNHHLTAVDLYRYDEAWELNGNDAFSQFFDPHPLGGAGMPTLKVSVILLDLREANDFNERHLPGAVNIPMNSVKKSLPSPFFNSEVLRDQWQAMESFFGEQVKRCTIPGVSSLQGRRVLMTCYTGDTARVATSILQAKNIDAHSIAGGAGAVAKWWPKMRAGTSCFEQEKMTNLVTVMSVGEA